MYVCMAVVAPFGFDQPLVEYFPIISLFSVPPPKCQPMCLFLSLQMGVVGRFH